METEALPSAPRAGLGHAAAIAGGNLLLVTGGCSLGGVALSSVKALDLSSPRERRLFPVRLGEARSSCSAAAASERETCVAGGRAGGHQALSSAEILNASTEAASQGPPMLESCAEFAAALVGGSTAAAGGWRGQAASTCEQLSTRADSDKEARRRQPLHSVTTERGYGLFISANPDW